MRELHSSYHLIAVYSVIQIWQSSQFPSVVGTSLGWSLQECASLYRSNNSEERFLLSDGSQITNFDEEYVLGVGSDNPESWGNSTQHFDLFAGCSLTICNDTHLNGKCQVVEESSQDLPQHIDAVMSANCSCRSTNECSCSQIHMRRTTCARAYLNNGCNTCNPYYFDMKGEREYFPKGNVRALKVREGCILLIYDEEGFAGESQIFEGTTIESFKGTIGSYTCECDPSFFIPKPKPPRNPEFPPFVNVPSTIDEVSSMITGGYGRHPGLMAALKSLKNRRSSRNAYILMLGSTGSGKSSAINLLFDNPNITRVGGVKSTTTDIHEFRIPISIDELGISNSELRVIDTPGLGDTRGLEQDAKFLATLDEYLENHEELNNRIPNVVMIFHKFSDNRFDGEASLFVKMLRGLDTIRKRISDDSYSNIVFVLSHFSAALDNIKKRPQARLRKFKNVIESYTQFPKPVVIAVAENRGADYDLPMVNGYYKLPNGDFYPRNLFEKIQTVTSSCGDPIGDAVIRSAFRDSDDFNTSAVDFPLVRPDHPKVSSYLSVLIGAVIKVENTEVSRYLAEAQNRMDPQLRHKHPHSIHYLQKALNIRNIRTIAEVPKTMLGVLELLSSLQQNKAVMFLLQNGLGLNPPRFHENVITGHSYTIFRDSHILKSPFNLGETINSDIGYLFPSAMTCNLQNHVEDFLQIDQSRNEYILNRLSSLGIQGTIPLEKFSGTVKPGYNIQSESFQNGKCILSALREFRTFELVLNDKPKLTKDFYTVLKSLPAFNETISENVRVWEDFFNEYGTHVVQQVYGGGSIEIQVISNSSCDGSLASSLFQFVQFAEDITIIKDDSVRESFTGRGITQKLRFRGGDQIYHTEDLTKMSLEDASNLLKNWRKSLKLHPVILTTEMKLLPISQIAKDNKGQNISSEIQRVTSLLFNSSLKYVPPSSGDGPGDRGSVAVVESYSTLNSMLQTFLNQSQQAQRRFDIMMEKLAQEKDGFEKRILREEQSFDEWLKEQAANRINSSKSDQANRDHSQKLRQQRMEEKIRMQEELERQRREDELRRRRELERLQREHQQRMEELRRKIREDEIRRRNQRRGGSCLKTGTRILLASQDHNGSFLSKPIELIEVGDLVLDGQLNPVKVLGISKEFLLQQSFFGFNDQDKFFTDSHIIIGPARNANMEDPHDIHEVQYFVQDKGRLLDQNPLMRYIYPQKMRKTESFQVYHYNYTTKTVDKKNVNLFKDSSRSHHPEDTLVYFMTVGSPTQSYFANNYLCRDEVPPVHKWPNTMATLLKVASHPKILPVLGNIPYSLKSLSIINSIVSEVELNIKKFLKNIPTNALSVGQPLMELKEIEVQKNIAQIFSHPNFSAFGMGLYGSLGTALATHLDGFDKFDTNNSSSQSTLKSEPQQEYLGSLQSLIVQAMESQLSTSLNNHLHELDPTTVHI